MKGLSLLGSGKMEVREFDTPKAGKDEAVVRIKVGAICGSDLILCDAPAGICPTPGVIAGHEPSGIVTEIGENVTNVKAGDRVAVYHYTSCGVCEHCRKGNKQNCLQRKGLGWTLNGSSAEYIKVPAQNCLILPQELSFIDGAFISCIAGTTFSSLSKISVSGKDNLVVYGLGPVGLTAAVIGRAMGARVIGVEKNKYRIRLAARLGLGDVIDAGEQDVKAEIMRLTDGLGPEKSLETTGVNAVRILAADCAATRGSIAVIGNSGGIMDPNVPVLAHFDQRDIIRKELTICGSFVMPIGMYEELTRFLTRHGIDFSKLVTHRFKLDDAIEAYRLFASGDTGKVIFEF